MSAFTLRELLAQIVHITERHPELLDAAAVVPVCNPAMGGRQFVQLTGFHPGFDWEKGRPIFSTDALVLRVPARPEIVKVEEVIKNTHGGATVRLVHAGGYMGKNVRTELAEGTRVFLGGVK